MEELASATVIEKLMLRLPLRHAVDQTRWPMELLCLERTSFLDYLAVSFQRAVCCHLPTKGPIGSILNGFDPKEVPGRVLKTTLQSNHLQTDSRSDTEPNVSYLCTMNTVSHFAPAVVMSCFN